MGKIKDSGGLPNSNNLTRKTVIERVQLNPSADSNLGETKRAAIKHFGSWSNARIAAGMGLDSGGIRSTNKTTLYLIYFPGTDLYKIGITQINPKKRFSKFPEYKIIDLFQTDYSFACELERDVLSKVNKVKHPALYRNGETECFKLDKKPSGLEDLL